MSILSDAIDDEMPALIEIMHRQLWTITRDFAFLGDYTQERLAVVAVDVAVADIYAACGSPNYFRDKLKP